MERTSRFFLAVVFLCSALLPSPGGTVANSPGLTHVYRAERKTYEAAKAACEAMGARLAVPNSEAEAQLIGNLAKHSSSSSSFTFVGRYYNGQQWLTLDGTTVAASGYEGWRTGEPNYSTFTLPDGSRSSEKCAGIDSQGLLNDIACEFENPYVCEFYRRPCVKT